jgi:predicted RNase H-like HicB family nuclease
MHLISQAWLSPPRQTLDVAKELIRGAVDFHLEGLPEYGDPIPVPSAHQ